jgi:hypothetical protein
MDDGVIDIKQNNKLSRYGGKCYQISDNDDLVSLRNLIHELPISKKWQDPNNDGWITIDNPSHVQLILENYADSDKRKILDVTSETPLQITKILNVCNMPQTSAYRKITSLIQNGLIIREGFTFSHGRRLVRYKPVFEKVQINMMKNRITLKVIPVKG